MNPDHTSFSKQLGFTYSCHSAYIYIYSLRHRSIPPHQSRPGLSTDKAPAFECQQLINTILATPKDYLHFGKIARRIGKNKFKEITDMEAMAADVEQQEEATEAPERPKGGKAPRRRSQASTTGTSLRRTGLS